MHFHEVGLPVGEGFEEPNVVLSGFKFSPVAGTRKLTAMDSSAASTCSEAECCLSATLPVLS